jgi:hypothetical protein
MFPGRLPLEKGPDSPGSHTLGDLDLKRFRARSGIPSVGNPTSAFIALVLALSTSGSLRHGFMLGFRP